MVNSRELRVGDCIRFAPTQVSRYTPIRAYRVVGADEWRLLLSEYETNGQKVLRPSITPVPHGAYQSFFEGCELLVARFRVNGLEVELATSR